MRQPVVAVVEDERSVRIALGRLLRAAGYTAELFASGEDFLACVDDQLPDCLLLDLQLTGMNGLDVLARLQQSGLGVPVVFVTACEGTESKESAMRSGAVAWLLKPIHEQDLLDALRDALLGRPGARESFS